MLKAWTRVDHGDGIHKRLETMRKEKALGTVTAADYGEVQSPKRNPEGGHLRAGCLEGTVERHSRSDLPKGARGS